MAELTRRYVVMTLATEAPFDPGDTEGVFVLKPWKDPAALRALLAYRDSCYPELARDLDAWIRVIEAGPRVRGDVGARNEPHAARGHRRSARPPAGRTRKGKPAAPPAGRTSVPPKRRRGHRRRKQR
jgi:hypothetical protein